MQRTQRRKGDFNPITCILVDVDCCKLSIAGCRYPLLLMVVYRFVVVRRMPVDGVSVIKLLV